MDIAYPRVQLKHFFNCWGGGAPEDQSKVRGAFAQKRLRTTGLDDCWRVCMRRASVRKVVPYPTQILTTGFTFYFYKIDQRVCITFLVKVDLELLCADLLLVLQCSWSSSFSPSFSSLPGTCCCLKSLGGFTPGSLQAGPAAWLPFTSLITIHNNKPSFLIFNPCLSTLCYFRRAGL